MGLNFDILNNAVAMFQNATVLATLELENYVLA